MYGWVKSQMKWKNMGKICMTRVQGWPIMLHGNYGIGGHLICEYPNVEWISNEDGLD